MRIRTTSIALVVSALFASGCVGLSVGLAANKKEPKIAYPEELATGRQEIGAMLKGSDPNDISTFDGAYETHTHISMDFRDLMVGYKNADRKLEKIYNANSVEAISDARVLGTESGRKDAKRMLHNLREGTLDYYDTEIKLNDRLGDWFEKYSGVRPEEAVGVKTRLMACKRTAADAMDAMEAAVAYTEAKKPGFDPADDRLEFDTDAQIAEYGLLKQHVESDLRVMLSQNRIATKDGEAMVRQWAEKVSPA